MTADRLMRPEPVGVSAAFGHSGELTLGRIVRTISRVTDAPIDLRTRSLVAACFDEFLRADCRPRVALRATAQLMDELGAARAQAGVSRRDIETAFVQVHDIVMSSLRQLTRGQVVGEPMLRLRRDVKHYLAGLHRQLCAAVAREEVRQDREHAERAALHGGLAVPEVEGPVRLVVAVVDELPHELLGDARFLPGRSCFEVVLPEEIDLAELENRVAGQVVVGPLTSGSELEESAVLVWRAAALLRDGRAVDRRRLVPFSELLGLLLISGSPVMARLLAEKHLAPLAPFTPHRRRELASTLLAWLERGVAGNVLAREIGVPPQTVHHRLKQCRDLFGAVLDEPTQRLELIVALRASQPEWAGRPQA